MTKLNYLILYLLISLTGCQSSDMKQYKSLVEKELRSNKKVNDIFFGISLGMTSKDFYVLCWNKNKEGLFTDGSGNTSVLYKLNDKPVRHPVEMNFYPEFYDGRIRNMWVKFQYAGWMPGNKE